MSKWLNQFLENMPSVLSDKSDSWNPKPDLALLSPPTMGVLGKNLENMPGAHNDKSDNWNLKPDLALLSPPSMDVFEKNLKNMSGSISDKSDNWDSHTISSFYDNYQERVAIAELDGKQNPVQARCIAYLDAFISLLSDLAENDSHRDWLSEKVQTALTTLEAQNLSSLN